MIAGVGVLSTALIPPPTFVSLRGVAAPLTTVGLVTDTSITALLPGGASAGSYVLSVAYGTAMDNVTSFISRLGWRVRKVSLVLPVLKDRLVLRPLGGAVYDANGIKIGDLVGQVNRGTVPTVPPTVIAVNVALKIG